MSERPTAADQVLDAARRPEAGRRLPTALCQALCEALPVDAAAIVLLTDTPYRQLLGVSDRRAVCLEEAEYLAGEGPCVTAAVTGQPVLVDDMARQLPKWPMFQTCLEQGDYRAVYAFPLRFEADVFGVVALLCERPGPITPQTMRDATQAVAATAQVLLPSFWRLLAHGTLPPWEPRDLLETHWATTHAASDRLAGRLGLPVEEALARLRARAFAGGQPLSSVAAQVLDPDS
ncbi:GAF and ANTAR domain-containing protein [Streptomyces sp. NPDC006422]|uniref:GAF and ANTAR domain-containing protein n=1 Tax=unclassified Streptomyces TaxID=2593676 RepID=UPI0033B1C205